MRRLLLLLLALSLGLFYCLTRLRHLRRWPALAPARSYADALRQLAVLQSAEGAAVLPVCRTQLLTHGQQTPAAIIFLHGFTNCPHQFHQLAQLYFERGMNVLNLRIPRHGMADRLTPELAHLTAEEMVEITAQAIDLAHGLGQEVKLLGFSLGGILAGWAAQHRPDLDEAILVSPAIGVRAVPPRRARLTANLALTLPNSFQWWDPQLEHQRAEPAHAYPRYATHGVGQLVRMGTLVHHEAQRAAPLARRITVITNPCDDVVDNATVAATVAGWRRHGATIHTHQFPAEWQLIHDLMDPAQPQQQVARVYPQLLEWLEGDERG